MLITEEAVTRLKGIVERLNNVCEDDFIEEIHAQKNNPFRNEGTSLSEHLKWFEEALRAKRYIELDFSALKEETVTEMLLSAANVVNNYINDASKDNLDRVLIGVEIDPKLTKSLERAEETFDDILFRRGAKKVIKFIEEAPTSNWDGSDLISNGVKVFKLTEDWSEFEEILESKPGFKEITTIDLGGIRIASRKECTCYHTHDQIAEIREKLKNFKHLFDGSYFQAIEILYPHSEHKVTYYIYVPE